MPSGAWDAGTWAYSGPLSSAALTRKKRREGQKKMRLCQSCRVLYVCWHRLDTPMSSNRARAPPRADTALRKQPAGAPQYRRAKALQNALFPTTRSAPPPLPDLPQGQRSPPPAHHQQLSASSSSSSSSSCSLRGRRGRGRRRRGLRAGGDAGRRGGAVPVGPDEEPAAPEPEPVGRAAGAGVAGVPRVYASSTTCSAKAP